MKKKILSNLVLGIVLSTLPAFATAETTEPSTYDKVWGYGTFIDNNEAKVIQKLAVVGRLQGDAYSFSSEDSSYEDIEWRRFRLGFKAKVFNDFTLHSELDMDMNHADQDSWDAFYNRLTDTYIAWSPSKKAKVKVGKQSAGFTLDGATSSKKLIVPERSIVAGNLWFTTEYFTGAAVYGNIEDWSYKVGGYSASGEAEFGHFESGYFALLSAGHKIGDTGSLHLDYVYNDPDYTSDYKSYKGKNAVGTKDLEHVVALVYKQMLNEKLGLWADVAAAKGIGGKNSDLLGIDIMPFYNFTDEFQLVLQYAGVTSLDDEADVKMSRYANKNSGKVETAHNLLLGFNWYLYGHKLKWQNAVEYNYGKNLAGTRDDYNGYGITSALRLSW
jgi:phosphate-selective porin OprO/OprP